MTKDEEKYTTLDTEQCKWWVNHLFSIAKEQACNSHNFNDAEEMQSAQDKIIKALEQEPCEDAVSRKAVLDMATVIETDDYSGNEIMKVVDTEDIKALPSVTPAPKKLKRAHWIDNHNGTISCSYCHVWFYKDDRYSYMRYCPYCNKKMAEDK